MANTSSAKKMVRKIERRTGVNQARRSRVRTYLRRVEQAIAAGDQEKAQLALSEATSELQRAVGKGVFHKNMAARKISRLSSRVKAIAA
jgi:small subunit ribosomal protein S20